jgi:hypothetical protein
MLPRSVTVGPLAAASANNIAQSQTPGAAGNLTLNGTTVTNGVAVLDTARRVLFTPAGAEATNGTIWTLYGTDWNGNAISETIAGVNNPATAQSVYDYKTVTRIAVNKAQAGAVTVGTNGVGSSRPIFLDTFAPGPTSLQVSASGTVNWTVRQSLDNPNAIGYAAVTWLNHPDTANMVSQTGSSQSNYAYIPFVVQLLLNSGTGTVTLTAIQADM